MAIKCATYELLASFNSFASCPQSVLTRRLISKQTNKQTVSLTVPTDWSFERNGLWSLHYETELLHINSRSNATPLPLSKQRNPSHPHEKIQNSESQNINPHFISATFSNSVLRNNVPFLQSKRSTLLQTSTTRRTGGHCLETSGSVKFSPAPVTNVVSHYLTPPLFPIFFLSFFFRLFVLFFLLVLRVSVLRRLITSTFFRDLYI